MRILFPIKSITARIEKQSVSEARIRVAPIIVLGSYDVDAGWSFSALSSDVDFSIEPASLRSSSEYGRYGTG